MFLLWSGGKYTRACINSAFWAHDWSQFQNGMYVENSIEKERFYGIYIQIKQLEVGNNVITMKHRLSKASVAFGFFRRTDSLSQSRVEGRRFELVSKGDLVITLAARL